MAGVACWGVLFHSAIVLVDLLKSDPSTNTLSIVYDRYRVQSVLFVIVIVIVIALPGSYMRQEIGSRL